MWYPLVSPPLRMSSECDIYTVYLLESREMNTTTYLSMMKEMVSHFEEAVV